MEVRVVAYLEENPRLGICRVKYTNGVVSSWTDRQTALKHIDYYNNEDRERGPSDYMYVPDPPKPKTAEEIAHEKYMEELRREWEINAEKKAEERRKAKEAKREANRKSKRSNEKYVYVISMIERGFSRTIYFEGETNLLTMKGDFAVLKVEKAKTFTTKASAQKVVDILEKNYLVRSLFRDLKVVQKDKKIFER